MREEWRPVVGYEGYYEVSNFGRVRSLTVFVICKNGEAKYERIRKGRVLRQPYASNGYKQVVLCKDGYRKIHRVHRLVATAFIDNPGNLPAINHKDENKTNNCVNNLEWCTTRYNNGYGSKPMKGERHPMSKLTKDDVSVIRGRHMAGESYTSIAKDFGMSRSHICGICKGNYWR